MKKQMGFWKEFWNSYPNKANSTEFFKQVGKTVNGVPISEEQFNTILSDINNNLSINQDDNVLDLCCGNGLITNQIAKNCRSVVGVDFSELLIQRALEGHKSTNIKYYQMDIRKIQDFGEEYNSYFSKVLWYEALAFFNKNDLFEILNALQRITTNNAIIFIGSVLDYDRKWNFFNTLKRKLNYIVNIYLLGREVGLGNWWKKKDVAEICGQLNYESEFLNQDVILHTSHYRFDVRIIRVDNSNGKVLSIEK